MKSFTSIFVGSALLAATSWIPTGESFRSVSLSSRHKISGNRNSNSNSNSNENRNENRNAIRRTMVSGKKTDNDDMLAAQEAEARKICPLLPPLEDVHATFEVAMG